MNELKSYTLETDQGPHLNLNEDLVDIDLGLQLFIVADGFGGSNIGDRIAGISRDHLKRLFGKMASDPDSTLPFFYSPKYLLETNVLINAFRGTHEQILKENQLRSLNSRGGASVIALALTENMASLVSTGNCRAYLLRKEKLMAQMLPDSFAGAPMSGIGLFEDFQFQVMEFKILTDDAIILLTDGAYERCDESEILEILKKYPDDEKMAIKEIFKEANGRGNMDNQSAMILQF
jgi:serine/threonine protein phosphatase PrpC